MQPAHLEAEKKVPSEAAAAERKVERRVAVAEEAAEAEVAAEREVEKRVAVERRVNVERRVAVRVEKRVAKGVERRVAKGVGVVGVEKGVERMRRVAEVARGVDGQVEGPVLESTRGV